MKNLDLSSITKTAAILVTVLVIVGVGAAKTAGIIDAETFDLALAALGFGGAGITIGGALSKGGGA